jgi:ABC-type sugar transport system ATPase subunit
LDEPLSNLDAKLREQMRFELKLCRNLSASPRFTSRTIRKRPWPFLTGSMLMHEGALLEVGTAADLYLCPAHRITADFLLGMSNFVPTAVESAGSLGGGEVLLNSPLVHRAQPEWRPASAAELFFRPENAESVADNAANGLNRSTGVVERTRFLGNWVDLVLRCGEIAIRARVHPGRTGAASWAFRGGAIMHCVSGGRALNWLQYWTRTGSSGIGPAVF